MKNVKTRNLNGPKTHLMITYLIIIEGEEW